MGYIIGYIRDVAPILPNAVPQALGDEAPAQDAAVEAEGGKRAWNGPSAKVPTQLFPMGGFDLPAGIAISPCGTFALVGTESESKAQVAHIDLSTGRLTFPYTGFSGPPTSVAIAPNGNFALVADSKSDQISYIDLQKGTVTVSYVTQDTGLDTPNQVAISPCSSFALVACEDSPEPDHHVARIDLSSSTTGKVTWPYSVDSKPQGIAIAPSGKFAILSYEGDKTGGIARLDLSSNSVEELHDDSRLQLCYQVAFAPSGGFTWVASPPYHGRVDLRTQEIAFALDYDEDGIEMNDPRGLAIAPSETYALVTSCEEGKVYCISNSAKSWKPPPTADEPDPPKKACCCSVM